MRETVEKLLGYVLIVVGFLAAVAACGYYIYQDVERQKGALALFIGVSLIISAWFWLTKDRLPRRATSTSGSTQESV